MSLERACKRLRKEIDSYLSHRQPSYLQPSVDDRLGGNPLIVVNALEQSEKGKMLQK